MTKGNTMTKKKLKYKANYASYTSLYTATSKKCPVVKIEFTRGGGIHQAYNVITIYSTRNVRIGSLHWAARSGKIVAIDVEPRYHRRGIATLMWNEAQYQARCVRGVSSPKQSDYRTAPGDKWARSISKRLPHNKLPRDHELVD